MTLLVIIIIILVAAYFIKYKKQNLNNNSDELFSTKEFTKKENIKSARCPQCGKQAKTYEEVKENFGLRKVGYATDIQSWCRECRRNKEELEDNQSSDKNLTLFDE